MQVYGTHYLADRRHSVQSMPRGISDMAGDEARMLQTYHCHVAEDIGNLRGASQQFPASHKAQSCTRHPGCLFVHIDATIALSRVRFAVFRAGMPMAHVAPKGRTPRSAEAFLRVVHTGFDHITDYRAADADLAFTEALMSAFALVSLKAPSLLAVDQERTEGNVHTRAGSQ